MTFSFKFSSSEKKPVTKKSPIKEPVYEIITASTILNNSTSTDNKVSSLPSPNSETNTKTINNLSHVFNIQSTLPKDDNPIAITKNRQMLNKMYKSLKMQRKIQKLAAENPNIFEYDSVYDDIQHKKQQIIDRQEMGQKARQPRYMNDINREHLKRQIRFDIGQQNIYMKKNKRDAKLGLFVDKEVFVTENYKRQLKETQVQKRIDLKLEENQTTFDDDPFMIGLHASFYNKLKTYDLDCNENKKSDGRTVAHDVNVKEDVEVNDRDGHINEDRMQKQMLNRRKERNTTHERKYSRSRSRSPNVHQRNDERSELNLRERPKIDNKSVLKQNKIEDKNNRAAKISAARERYLQRKKLKN